MVVDAEADMAWLREIASRPLHEALGKGLASQVYAIWHGLEIHTLGETGVASSRNGES